MHPKIRMTTLPGILLLMGAPAFAQLSMETSTSYDGTIVVVDPPNALVVSHAENQPQLTLTGGASSSGVQAVILGNLGGEEGELLLEGGSTLAATGSGFLGNFGSTAVQRGYGYIGLNSGSAGKATVTGPGSVWTNADRLIVGAAGSGELVISNGGLVSNAVGILGLDGASSGAATVTGTGSIWDSTGGLIVGNSGAGALSVLAGGRVISGIALVGNGSQKGTAVVSGANARWETVGALQVGSGSEGELNAAGGGVVTAGSVALGAGGAGTATVAGAGSRLESASSLVVGRNSAGSLAIETGGGVTSAAASIGSNAGGQGAVTVTGAGSTWENAGDFIIGGQSLVTAGGAGTILVGPDGAINVGGTTKAWDGSSLTIQGGTFSTGSLDRTTGTVDLQYGTLRISGGTYTQNAGALNIDGTIATATLELTAGASVAGVQNIALGTVAGQSGQLVVSDSALAGIGQVVVGETGSGNLTIRDGATVNAAGTVGLFDGSVGSAVVTGAGSRWESSSLTLRIGQSGQGSLLIESGAVVVHSVNSLGHDADGHGAATVTGLGSRWESGVALFIGEGGSGDLTITSGGVVAGNASAIGRFAGASGTVTVTGEGSRWENTGSLAVGLAGTGTLTIEADGLVQVGGTTSLAAGSTINLNGGTLATHSLNRSTGTFNHRDGILRIDGGTYTQAAGSLTISGNTTTAIPTLELVNGATTSGIQGFNLGGNGGRRGVLRVDNSTLTNSGIHVIGLFGSGEMTIENGGMVSNTGNATIGSFLGSQGTATVTGAGSAWDSAGNLTVASSGTGSLTIAAGAAVTSAGGAVGSQAPGNGSVAVTGTGSRWEMAGNLVVGGPNLTTAGGTGAVTVTSGGAIEVGGTLKLHGQGTLGLETGGTVEAQNFDGAAGFFDWTGGTLAVSGTVTGDLVVVEAGTFLGGGIVDGNLINEGTLLPGSSPGLLAVEDDFTQSSSGILRLELGGLDRGTSHDALNVGGLLTLGGTLQLEWYGGFQASLGDSFDLFDFGLITGSFGNIDATGAALDEGLFWNFDRLSIDGTVSVVPEPSCGLLLLGSGLAMAAFARRCRPRTSYSSLPSPASTTSTGHSGMTERK